MSIPVGTFITELCIQAQNPRGTADPVFIDQVWSKVREAYREVVSCYNWACLQNTVTLNNTTYLVPADCRIINTVFDSNKRPFHFVSSQNRHSDFALNYYLAPAISTPLAEGTTLNVGEYATAVSSSAEFPSANCAGEFIRIASNPSVYKIRTWTDVSNMVLQDNFRGDQQSSVVFQVRPRGTMVLAFSDSRGNTITPTDVQINYTRIPLLPYSENDLLELPGDNQAVEIKALQKILSFLGFSAAADKKSSEYSAALSAMKSNEPTPAFLQPTDLFRRGGRGRHGLGYMRMLERENYGQ